MAFVFRASSGRIVFRRPPHDMNMVSPPPTLFHRPRAVWKSCPDSGDLQPGMVFCFRTNTPPFVCSEHLPPFRKNTQLSGLRRTRRSRSATPGLGRWLSRLRSSATSREPTRATWAMRATWATWATRHWDEGMKSSDSCATLRGRWSINAESLRITTRYRWMWSSKGLMICPGGFASCLASNLWHPSVHREPQRTTKDDDAEEHGGTRKNWSPHQTPSIQTRRCSAAVGWFHPGVRRRRFLAPTYWAPQAQGARKIGEETKPKEGIGQIFVGCFWCWRSLSSIGFCLGKSCGWSKDPCLFSMSCASNVQRSASNVQCLQSLNPIHMTPPCLGVRRKTPKRPRENKEGGRPGRRLCCHARYVHGRNLHRQVGVSFFTCHTFCCKW